MVKYILGGFLLLYGCSSRTESRGADSDDIVVIFRDAPDHSISKRGIGSMSVLPYTVFDYVDREHVLHSFLPGLAGDDTITIPSHFGYAEVMHRNQAIEDNYYLLAAGDTVLFTYGENLRPQIRSLRSERNTWLYTLAEHDGRTVHRATGYGLNTLCAHDNMYGAMWRIITNPKYRDNRERLKRYRTLCLNIDSLKVIRKACEAAFDTYVDSLDAAGALPPAYAAFYRNRYGKSGAEELLRSDSLLWYPSSHRALQGILFDKDSAEIVRFCHDTTVSKYARLSAVHYLLRVNEDNGSLISLPAIAACASMYEELSGQSFCPETAEVPAATNPDALLVEGLDGRQTTFDEVLKAHAGKVIYVDLWASWCAPCRAGMPAAGKLRETYADSGVVFIYLSVNDGGKAWRRAVEQCRTATHGGINLRALNSKENLFLKEIGNRRIPQYLLYDRSGQLVNHMAPSPDSPLLQPILDELTRQ